MEPDKIVYTQNVPVCLNEIIDLKKDWLTDCVKIEFYRACLVWLMWAVFSGDFSGKTHALFSPESISALLKALGIMIFFDLALTAWAPIYGRFTKQWPVISKEPPTEKQ